jgi:hypothetical protein
VAELRGLRREFRWDGYQIDSEAISLLKSSEGKLELESGISRTVSGRALVFSAESSGIGSRSIVL